MVNLSAFLLATTLLRGSALRTGAVFQRYFGTTDTVHEVGFMAGCLNNVIADSVHLVLVTGGMSGLSMLPVLEERKQVSVTFFDYMPGTTDLAKMYVALIKASPTRHSFLEKFYARKISMDDAAISPENMKELVYEHPCNVTVKEEVLKILAREGKSVVDLYANEMIPLVACAKEHGQWPVKAWPVWNTDMSDVPGMGRLWGYPPSPKKTTTLWYGQVGWLKDDASYKATRSILSRAKIDYQQADLNSPALNLLAKPWSNSLAHTVIFTSNALGSSDWVKDGWNKTAMARKFASIAPSGTVVSNRCSDRVDPEVWSYDLSSR